MIAQSAVAAGLLVDWGVILLQIQLYLMTEPGDVLLHLAMSPESYRCASHFQPETKKIEAQVGLKHSRFPQTAVSRMVLTVGSHSLPDHFHLRPSPTPLARPLQPSGTPR